MLESTRRIDTILLDKTGTITPGEMSVTAVVLAEGEDLDEVLAVAGALEAASQHPVAAAITRHAADRLGDVRAGLQVRSRWTGWACAASSTAARRSIGRPAAARPATGITVPAALAAALGECYSQGGTGAVLAWSGRARAAFLVADTVRPTSAAAVAELRRLGLEPVLLTGDSAGAAMAVADQVGISAVIADALPEGKLEVVRRYQQAGHVVAMVGDGVNDAAALAQADLGLAMGSGHRHRHPRLRPHAGPLRPDRGGRRDPAVAPHPRA